MKTKRLLVCMLVMGFCVSLIMPTVVLADKGSNDFTATLSVSDTLVSSGTNVTCSITIKNTDPTYGADVAVSTSGGTLVSSFYLGAGQTRIVTHSVHIGSTTDIYYSVFASHGPDIYKTKNTNTVRVNIASDDDDLTPAPDIVIDTPDGEIEPVRGIPTSGSVFVVYIDNVLYDGIPIIDEGNLVVSSFDGPVTMTGEIHYHFTDSVAATYLDRAEEDYIILSTHFHAADGDSGLMDEIIERYTLTEDDGIIEFDQILEFNDVPAIYDDLDDYLYLNVNMHDPVEMVRALDYIHVGVVNGPAETDGYTVFMGDTYLNGHLVDSTEAIEVTYGEVFTIEQNIGYTMPEGELSVNDRHRVSIFSNCFIDGVAPYYVGAPTLDIVPSTAVGELTFEITGDATSFNPWRLDYGHHTIEIYALQDRETAPGIDNRAVMTLTINVVAAGPVDWGDPVEESDDLTIFDGVFEMHIWEWLGFLDDSVDLITEMDVISIAGEGDVELAGTVQFACSESFSIRISGSEGFGDPLELVSITSEGECSYNRMVHVTETTDFVITAELIDPVGRVIVSDTETVTVNVIPIFDIFISAQRYSLSSAPTVVGIGEDTTIYYSLSNEFSGERVHVRLIDEMDGSIVFEDENFEHFEIYDGSVTRTPDLPTHYRFRAQVIADDGSVLWEETKETFVIVLPNPAADDGEETVFNLSLGASAITIAPGESVNIYGAIDYGSFDPLDILGELMVNVTDQDDHILYLNASCMPHDVIAFSETYILDETTTFSITALGTQVGGDGTLTDTDTIIIIVEEPVVPIPPEEPVYDMTFTAAATETVIAPGDSVDITVALVNDGTGNVSTVIFDAAGEFFGDAIALLHPHDAMVAIETLTFTETTVVALRAVAWAEGDVVVFTETINLTIIVDPALADPPVDDGAGTYELEYDLIAREMTIMLGETTDVYIDVMNVGDETVDIVVSEPMEGPLFEAHDITPGTRFDNVLHWGPTSTSVMTIQVQALDEHGAVVYSQTQAITVTVVEPEPEPAEDEASIDLDVTASETLVERGQEIDIHLSITNTGAEMIDNYVLAESVTGSFAIGLDLAAGAIDFYDILGWSFDVHTMVTFHVGAYNADGVMVAEDTVSIIFEVVESEPEPVPEDADPGEEPPAPAPPEDDEPDEGMLDDIEPSGDAPEADTSDSPSDADASDDMRDEVFSGGIELSLEPVAMDAVVVADDGEIIIVSSNPESNENLQRIYRARRLLLIIIFTIALLLIILIIMLIVMAAKRRHKDKKEDDFDDVF